MNSDRDTDTMSATITTTYPGRSHLKPSELARLMGLKTADKINAAIKSGALPATVLPECPRLRFVEIPDFLAWTRSQRPYVSEAASPRPVATVKERRAHARANRKVQGSHAPRRARGLS